MCWFESSPGHSNRVVSKLTALFLFRAVEFSRFFTLPTAISDRKMNPENYINVISSFSNIEVVFWDRILKEVDFMN